jgi:hypothetical protein
MLEVLEARIAQHLSHLDPKESVDIRPRWQCANRI